MKQFINCTIFNGASFTEDTVVRTLDEKIVYVGNTADNVEDTIDCQNQILSPGMIDLQLNGNGGVMFNQEQSYATLQTMSATNFKFGCTSFLPTLITSPDDKIMNALQLFESNYDFKQIGALGIHLEGPMISKSKKGIHNENHIRLLSQTIIDAICASTNVKMITLAPETVPLSVVQQLANSKIKISLGHTEAQYENLQSELITHSTHLYNAMAPLSGRAFGPIGHIFNHKKIYTGIIADGDHVSDEAIAFAFMQLPDYIYTTSDAAAGQGMTYDFDFDFSDTLVNFRNGRCIGPDGQLAGSAITMIDSLKHLVFKVKIPLESALKSVTLTPANAIDEHTLGRIEEGCFADFILLDKNSLNLMQTYKHGSQVYSFNL